MDPPTEPGVTVTVASLELAGVQLPLVTTALYLVVIAMLVAVYVATVLTMSMEVAQLSVEYCHFVMDPVYPERVSRVLFVPPQTEADPETEPPTEGVVTVIVASVELMGEQVPLVINALYFVVVIRLVAVYVAVVLAMSFGVTQLSVDHCHLVMVPVYPERVRSVLLVPVQTEVPPAMLPPTDAGSTVTLYTAGEGAYVPVVF